MTRRAVFLDRDGVLAESLVRSGKPSAARSLTEFRVVPQAAEAIRALRGHGFLTIVVTNQPDVARGITPLTDVEAMHTLLREQLNVDDIKVCFHDDDDNCSCRKPKPGMLLEAAASYGIDLTASYLIGDRWRDIVAGRAAGCFTLLIDHGLREEREARSDETVSTLADAVGVILAREAQHQT
jgi:D-glycero-D-manno-heptose 1,7-bisphosphate phosphatase